MSDNAIGSIVTGVVLAIMFLPAVIRAWRRR